MIWKSRKETKALASKITRLAPSLDQTASDKGIAGITLRYGATLIGIAAWQKSSHIGRMGSACPRYMVERLVMFFDVLIRVVGPKVALNRFREMHLSLRKFSLESVAPTPEVLLFDVDNVVEDGYEAIFGDWTALRARRMYKEPAEKLGLAFPLESREALLSCIGQFGEIGVKMLKGGERLKHNLENFGVKSASPWRMRHWGSEVDFSESVILVSEVELKIAFCSPSVAKKVLANFSKLHPDLTFEVKSVDENGRQPKQFGLQKAKQVDTAIESDAEISTAIWTFRREIGTRWAKALSRTETWTRQIDMNERGRARFKNTEIAVDFALFRVRNGESPEYLATRFPELNADHVNALVQLTSTEHRDGLRIFVADM